MKIIQIIVLGIFTALFVFTRCTSFNEKEFIKKELSGSLVKIEDATHGYLYLYVRGNKDHDTIRYTLLISKFIRENNVQLGDSISKEAGDHTIWFYKKSDGIFSKSVSLYYYQ